MNLTLIIGCFVIAVKVKAWLLTVVEKKKQAEREVRGTLCYLEKWHLLDHKFISPNSGLVGFK